MNPAQGEQDVVDRYFLRLRKHLAPLPEPESADILRELATHVEEGLVRGQAAETVLAEMGEPEAVAAAMLAERLVTVEQRRSATEMAGIVLGAAFRPFWLTVLVLVLVDALTYVFIFEEMTSTWGMVGRLVLGFLPQTTVAAIPVAAMAVGLFGIPCLTRTLSPSMFRRVQRRVAVAVLVGSALLSGLVFVFEDTLVLAANRQIFDTRRVQIYKLPPLAEAERSVEELSLSEARTRLAEQEQACARLVLSNAPYGRIQAAEAELLDIRVRVERKLSVPAFTFGLGALGLALGLCFARLQVRRTVRVGSFLLGNFLLTPAWFPPLSTFLVGGLPALVQAWLPVVVPLVLAAVIAFADAAWCAWGTYAEEV